MHPTRKLPHLYSDYTALYRGILIPCAVGSALWLAIAAVVYFLTTLLSAGPSHAQTFTGVRAVAFPHTGGSCYYKQITPAFTTSPRYEASIWIDGSAVVAPGSQQNLSASNLNGANPTNVMQVQLFNSQNDPNLQNGLHLFFYTSDGTNTPNTFYNQWVSNELLDFPEPWVHAYIFSDTSNHFSNGNYTVTVFWHGIELTPNAHYTHGNLNETPPYSVFNTPWSNNGTANTWTTGCFQNPVSGVFSSFYTGGMAEDYETILTDSDLPALALIGQFSPQTGRWQPQELGPMCLNPRPANPAPTKCQRGGASGITTNTFPYNLFPITSQVFSRFGPVTPLAVDDPFVTIP